MKPWAPSPGLYKVVTEVHAWNPSPLGYSGKKIRSLRSTEATQRVKNHPGLYEILPAPHTHSTKRAGQAWEYKGWMGRVSGPSGLEEVSQRKLWRFLEEDSAYLENDDVHRDTTLRENAETRKGHFVAALCNIGLLQSSCPFLWDDIWVFWEDISSIWGWA